MHHLFSDTLCYRLRLWRSELSYTQANKMSGVRDHKYMVASVRNPSSDTIGVDGGKREYVQQLCKLLELSVESKEALYIYIVQNPPKNLTFRLPTTFSTLPLLWLFLYTWLFFCCLINFTDILMFITILSSKVDSISRAAVFVSCYAYCVYRKADPATAEWSSEQQIQAFRLWDTQAKGSRYEV